MSRALEHRELISFNMRVSGKWVPTDEERQTANILINIVDATSLQTNGEENHREVILSFVEEYDEGRKFAIIEENVTRSAIPPLPIPICFVVSLSYII